MDGFSSLDACKAIYQKRLLAELGKIIFQKPLSYMKIKFHLTRHLLNAVDTVRKQAHAIRHQTDDNGVKTLNIYG